MNNDKENILRKVKACLALSKSKNEHEAAIALNMAKNMMKNYNLSEAEVEYSSLSKSTSQAKSSVEKLWVLVLIAVIERSFIVTSVLSSYSQKVNFYGNDLNAELAKYAFDVLYSQIIFARKNYIEQNLRRYKKANKTLRADQYALGWASSLRKAIQEFISEDDLQNIQKLHDIVTAANTDLTFVKEPKNKKLSDLDRRHINAGINDSDSASLFRAMNNNEKKRIG